MSIYDINPETGLPHHIASPHYLLGCKPRSAPDPW